MEANISNYGDSFQIGNASYVRELIVLKKDDFISLLNPITTPNELSGYTFIPYLLNYKAGVEFHKISFSQNSCTFSERKVTTPNGKSYLVVFSFDVSKNNSAFAKWLFDAQEKEYIVFFRDGNFETYISGTVDVGLEFNFDRRIDQKNGYRIELTGNLSLPTFHTSERYLTDLLEYVEFSNEFSDEFDGPTGNY